MDFGDVPLGIRSSVATLSGLLRQSWRLRVPRFQRPYSWTEAEVGRLLEDLRIAMTRKYPFYFFGTIVLIYEGGEAADIVDGQQRLTTFTILLASLRDRVKRAQARAALEAFIVEGNGSGLGRLRLRPVDQAFFARYVQAPGMIAELCAASGLQNAQEVMANAAREIADALDDLEKEGALEAFAEYICHRATFNVIETTDREGAPRLFKSLNDPDRECDLSAADLVRSELFEMANLPDEEADECAHRWDELAERVGQRTMDDLLGYMPEILGAQTIPGEMEISVLRRRFLGAVDASAFLREGILHYGEALESIRNAAVDADAESTEINRRLRCLQLLRGERMWVAPALAMVSNGPRDPVLWRRFFIGIERLVYTSFLGIVPSHKRIERFSGVLKAGFDEGALFGEGGALELTARERRDLIKRLNDPFKDDKRRRIVALRTNAAVEPFYETIALTDDASVEHVLPARPSGAWLDLFPDPVNRELLTHIIGNWVLITQKQNKAAAAKPFADKRRVYFETRDAPMRALTAMLRETTVWDPAAVRRRQEKLVTALSADWRLSDPSL